jgi:tryptophan halogenase
MDVPDKLASKLELWRSKGRLFRDGQELFGPASWVAVPLGQGVIPEEPDPVVSKINPDMTADVIDKMRLSYRLMAEQMPPHAEFIANACTAKAVAPS